MKNKRIFYLMERAVHRWFMLGMEDEEMAQYNALSEYNPSLAGDNLTALKGYCKVSYLIIAILILVKCLTGGEIIKNSIAGIVMTAGILLIQILHKQLKQRMDAVRLSYILTVLFDAFWYAFAIYYDAVIESGTPAIMSCVAFVLLASLFNAHPLDNIIASLLAYACMMTVEMLYASPEVCRTDAFHVFISMMLGIGINQKNTRSNVSRMLYTDMYKTATQTSILVAQINIARNTFEILQRPDYMAKMLSEAEDPWEGLKGISEQFVQAEFRKQFVEIFDFKTITERIDKNQQLNLYFLDFRQRWCQLTIVEQKRHNNKVYAIVAIVRDVDDEHRREFAYQEKLKEVAEEAKRASVAKTSFLRRMSHDIRTPINGIRGMLEIADHYENDLEKQTECRQKVKEASGYLLSLVNDVLDMNKLESGSIELENTPFDLYELLREANAIAQMQAVNQGIHYVIDKENGYVNHRYLIGSTVHLKQILHNFASNAIKYNKENGTVTVTCQELFSDEEEAVYRFVCSDTGIGMSDEFQKHAFEPFAQEERMINTAYAGTGLGLSIIKELAECMGGRIEMTSKLDVGSTFAFIVPLKINPDPQRQDKAVERKVDVRGKKVLLVEDNDLNMEIAEFLLENEGLRVDHAADGREAVEKFSQSGLHEYSIIFMDIMMPVMGGLEAARKIRAMDREDAQTVSIIAMSANAFQDDIARSREAGMNAHLSKPLDFDKVRKTIQRIVQEGEG